MLDKLELIYFRYKDLESQLSDPEVVSDMQKFKKTSKDKRKRKKEEQIFKVYSKFCGAFKRIICNSSAIYILTNRK